MMVIELLPEVFSVCKLAPGMPLPRGTWFAAHTPTEDSLVCETRYVSAHTMARDDGWRAFMVRGPLEFSLIGILAGITDALAKADISVFCVSTYDTDYVLIKSQSVSRASDALQDAGYEVTGIDG